MLTCQPADPASKGGVEAAVKISKADLVPTETNLRDQYETFAELVQACEEFMDQVNGRSYRVTRRIPVEMQALGQAVVDKEPSSFGDRWTWAREGVR